MSRLTGIGLALLVVLALAFHPRPADAQQRAGQGKGAPQVLGVSFDLALQVRKGTAAAETFATLQGRFNTTGEFEARLSFPEFGLDAGLIVLGGRLYLRLDTEGWYVLDQAMLVGVAGQATGGTGGSGNLSDACVAGLTRFLRAMPAQGASFADAVTATVGPDRLLEGVSVFDVRGSIDLALVFEVLGGIAAAAPACGLSTSDIGDLVALLREGDLPPIRYEVTLRRADLFPYVVRLAVADEADEFILLVNLRPSETFFPIQAPANARPFDPTSLAGLLGP